MSQASLHSTTRIDLKSRKAREPHECHPCSSILPMIADWSFRRHKKDHRNDAQYATKLDKAVLFFVTHPRRRVPATVLQA